MERVETSVLLDTTGGAAVFKGRVLQKKLQLHLWYLTEEMVPLFLFDNHVCFR